MGLEFPHVLQFFFYIQYILIFQWQEQVIKQVFLFILFFES